MPPVAFGSVTDPERWKIHRERTLYDSPWVRLELVDVEPPGLPRFEHHVVRLHHVAIAGVVDELDRVLMLRRYRFLPDRAAWELPGGIVNEGEDPGTAAAREVVEETGWRPRKLRHIVTFEPQIGMVQSPHEVFLGRGADQVGPPTDVEEAGQVDWIPIADLPGMLAAGELAGSGTLVAVLHLLAFGPPDPPAKPG